MPSDYLHLLNCVCLFNVNRAKDCWNAGDVMVVGAKKMTADSWANIVDDVYNRPTKKHPYYYIHNKNDIKVDDDKKIAATNSDLPTNVTTDALHSKSSGFSRTFNFTGSAKQDAVEQPSGSRYTNASTVTVEIRCGNDKSNIFELAAVQIDYLKAPQYIRLTQEELDSDEDISQVLEFPDYVNQEIINELVNLVMRKINDPSL